MTEENMIKMQVKKGVKKIRALNIGRYLCAYTKLETRE